jgi:Ca-activated chloride channel family protein
VNGDAKNFAYDVKFGGDSSDDFIPRLWATRRVGYLMDEIRLQGENKELKDEVTELARKYGIVTPYTAYLIQEDETRRGVPLSMRSMPTEDTVRMKREVDLYKRVQADKSGDIAVANARSFQMLKQAEAPQSSINAGNYEALRGPMNAPVAATPSASSGMAGGRTAVGKSAPAEDRAKEVLSYQQQNRFAAGRNFFRNGSQWIDSQVQSNQQANRRQVQFGSDEYFALAKTNSNAKAWLAVGRNVQFVLGDTVYDVVD